MRHRRISGQTRRAVAAVALIGTVWGVAVATSAANATRAHTAAASTLVVDTSFIVSSIDPARDLDPTGYIVDRALYDTLLTEYGANTKVEPELASSYSASPNATTYTFHLRPDARWSDGKSVTAMDFVEGRMLRAARGYNGFGYDPLFCIDALGKTTAELPSEEKHAISHRGKALRKLHDLMVQMGMVS